MVHASLVEMMRRRAEVVAGSDFDVVVVGGGSAGCVVAARLAEASSRSVALLEAGPDLRADLHGVLHPGGQAGA